MRAGYEHEKSYRLCDRMTIVNLPASTNVRMGTYASPAQPSTPLHNNSRDYYPRPTPLLTIAARR